jgi:hypothetical protein
VPNGDCGPAARVSTSHARSADGPIRVATAFPSGPPDTTSRIASISQGLRAARIVRQLTIGFEVMKTTGQRTEASREPDDVDVVLRASRAHVDVASHSLAPIEGRRECQAVASAGGDGSAMGSGHGTVPGPADVMSGLRVRGVSWLPVLSRPVLQRQRPCPGGCGTVAAVPHGSGCAASGSSGHPRSGGERR